MQFLGKENVPVFGWTEGVPVEDEALKQVMNCAKMPFIYRHIALMPDVHHGKGSTIGSVIPTKKAIIPAAVGVDIGCGMLACRTNIKADRLPDSLALIRSDIEAAVPHGRTDNGGDNDRGAWNDIPERVQKKIDWDLMQQSFSKIEDKHPKLSRWRNRFKRHLGTLGTGNHFVELCLDESNTLWIMLHSGSRGVGNAIGTYFIELAKQDMRKYFINLPDQDLAYLPEGTDYFDDYMKSVAWAQNYARLNRETMLESIQSVLLKHFPDILFEEKAINCHHNYVNKEHHFGENVYVTRKGAVRAREGDLGIIPGSMGAKSFIVRGKGNADSFHSCSHGAGRIMSRTKANKTITLEDHARDTMGVECRKDAEVLDESPKAYKDIQAVMAAQNDLVEIVHVLKQVVCIKG